MYKIRKNVFETNSSSTHSICITTNRRTSMCHPEHVHFRCDEFGWEWRRLDTVDEKAAYLYSSMVLLLNQKELQKATEHIVDTLYRFGITCTFDEPEYNDLGSGFRYCSNADIDHCGADEHRSFESKTIYNEGRLIRYLFSRDSFVLTGNDNQDGSVAVNVRYPHETYYKGC